MNRDRGFPRRGLAQSSFPSPRSSLALVCLSFSFFLLSSFFFFSFPFSLGIRGSIARFRSFFLLDQRLFLPFPFGVDVYVDTAVAVGGVGRSGVDVVVAVAVAAVIVVDVTVGHQDVGLVIARFVYRLELLRESLWNKGITEICIIIIFYQDLYHLFPRTRLVSRNQTCLLFNARKMHSRHEL